MECCLPFEYPTGAAALSRARRLLYRYWPSARLEHDPLSAWRVEDRYAAVSIANWKLTPMMRRALLERRVVHPLSFATDRRLTIVIPFRDREAHLRELLPPLIAVLREQRIRHRILVVEQEPGSLFNRGKLINVGMHHAVQDSDYYCLHDVDAVPLVANYACPSQPLRLISTLLEPEMQSAGRGREAGQSQPLVLPTDHDFLRATYRAVRQCARLSTGGAISISKEQAFAANGYSNEYWGWGKEDDDFFFRLLLCGMLCYYDTQGRFLDLPNPARQQARRDTLTVPPNLKRNRRRRSRLMRGLLDPAQDGLSTLRYEVIDHRGHGDHERLRVRL